MSNTNRTIVVNDHLTCIPNTRTLWHHLTEWFAAEFINGDYSTLASRAESRIIELPHPPSIIIRNGTYFPWFTTRHRPVIPLIQDIQPFGSHLHQWQLNVGRNSNAVVFNSEHTKSFYPELHDRAHVIPLGVDFDVFKPHAGTEKKYDVVWVGAGTAIKGWDDFQRIVRGNPDLRFACVTKDGARFFAYNVEFLCQLPQDEMVRVYNESRVGLCTSKQETQHLAGIEMAACGLWVVAPPVGVYSAGATNSMLSLSGKWMSSPVSREIADYSAELRAVLSGQRPNCPVRVLYNIRKSGLSLADCKQSWLALVKKVLDEG